MDIHSRLVVAIEQPETAYLWVPDDSITFTPGMLKLTYGDGRALFWLSTINQRPAYWVIRGCSSWETGYGTTWDTDGPDFGSMTDQILTDLEEQFGDGRCGYSGSSLFFPIGERGCDCDECTEEQVAVWPMVDGYGGCQWGRVKWPAGFETVENGYLLAADADGSTSATEKGAP